MYVTPSQPRSSCRHQRSLLPTRSDSLMMNKVRTHTFSILWLFFFLLPHWSSETQDLGSEGKWQWTVIFKRDTINPLPQRKAISSDRFWLSRSQWENAVIDIWEFCCTYTLSCHFYSVWKVYFGVCCCLFVLLVWGGVEGVICSSFWLWESLSHSS